jgi:ABC-type phosphate transport system substrate-binding protein
LRPLVIATILSLLAGAGLPHARSDEPGANIGIVFIVNSHNPVSSVSVRDLTDYYQKTKRQWPDGSAVRFIDRDVGSPERAVFLSRILKQSESAVQLYWYGKKLHSGDSIPIQVSTDTMAIETVATFDGAIGYVSSHAQLKDPRIKAISVTNGATVVASPRTKE